MTTSPSSACAHSDHTGGGGAEGCIVQVDSRKTQIGVGLLEIGTSNGYIFLAAAFDSFVIALLCCPKCRFGTLQSRVGKVAVLCRELILAEKPLSAVVFEFLFLEIGLCIEHRLLRRIHFLSCEFPRA